MEPLYSLTIVANFTLFAVIIALFVYTSSIYGVALINTREQQEKYSQQKKAIVSSRKKEIERKISELASDTDFVKQSLSIIASSVSLANSTEDWIIPVWVLSLIFLGVGLYLLINALFSIQELSKSIDLSSILEKSLSDHDRALRPVVGIEFPDYQLHNIAPSSTEEIEAVIFLREGIIAKNVEVRFGATSELQFPDEEISSFNIAEYMNMNNPNQFTKKVDSLNKDVYYGFSFNLKAPDKPGKYYMSYWITSDLFTGDDTSLMLEVRKE